MTKLNFTIATLLVGCVGGCAMGDYSKELSGDYLFVSESGTNQFIVKRGHREGDLSVACNVVSFSFNDDFILAAQVPTDNCIGAGRNELWFWVIDHASDLAHGPLGLHDYLATRDSLGVPPELSLKLQL